MGNDSERALRKKISPGPYGHTHNNFLQQLLEHGIVGFSAFIFLFGSILWVAFRDFGYYKARGERSLSIVSAASFSAISGFLTAGLFEFNFGTSYVLMPVLTYVGFTVALDTRRKERELNLSGNTSQVVQS
jgi:O-antigen ligase